MQTFLKSALFAASLFNVLVRFFYRCIACFLGREPDVEAQTPRVPVRHLHNAGNRGSSAGDW